MVPVRPSQVIAELNEYEPTGGWSGLLLTGTHIPHSLAHAPQGAAARIVVAAVARKDRTRGVPEVGAASLSLRRMREEIMGFSFGIVSRYNHRREASFGLPSPSIRHPKSRAGPARNPGVSLRGAASAPMMAINYDRFDHRINVLPICQTSAIKA